MPTTFLFPTEDAYVVGNAGVDYKNFGKDTRLWISSDSYPGFSVTGQYHETAWTYLKFNIGDIKPEWIKSVALHLYIPDARFVGSTVQVTDLAIRIYSVTSEWNETAITWANKPMGEFIQRVILLSCQETGICGVSGLNQVGGSFNLGHVRIPLLFWRVYNGYINLILQPGADNNAMWLYSREASVSSDLKPRLEVVYEITAEKELEKEPETEKPVITPPAEIPKTGDIMFIYERGLRQILVRVADSETTLTYPNDVFVVSVPLDQVLEVVTRPKIGLLGYKANIKYSENKESVVGLLWKLKIKNAEIIKQ